MAERVEFTSTAWTLVRQAKNDPAALSRLIELYRPPIVNFIAAQGHTEEAEDLAQEVFIRLSRPGFFDRVEISKGKFRTLLLAVTKRTAIDHDRIRKARKRGGTRRALSLDQLREEDSRFDPAAKVEEDPEFDRLWTQNLVRQALLRYAKECNERRSKTYNLFHDHVLLGNSQEEVARSHGRKVQDVKNAVHQTKAKIRIYVEELVRDYANEDSDTELASLARWLPAK
jgi:RNA polymerase sigma factor (sigma-70 family)